MPKSLRDSLASTFFKHCSVCAAVSVLTNLPVAGSVARCPDTNSQAI
jgi:hypothetical protein